MRVLERKLIVERDQFPMTPYFRGDRERSPFSVRGIGKRLGPGKSTRRLCLHGTDDNADGRAKKGEREKREEKSHDARAVSLGTF